MNGFFFFIAASNELFLFLFPNSTTCHLTLHNHPCKRIKIFVFALLKKRNFQTRVFCVFSKASNSLRLLLNHKFLKVKEPSKKYIERGATPL